MSDYARIGMVEVVDECLGLSGHDRGRRRAVGLK